MRFDKVEQYRRPHPMGFPHKTGDEYGWFEIPSPVTGRSLSVMAAPVDEEWQHVSVSAWSPKPKTPCWDEMCFVKDLFWNEDQVVVQFHPAKKDYINFATNCLHLWHWRNGKFPTPPKEAVGPS